MSEFADRVLTEVRFWAQVTTDSERTIVCSAENESRIKGWIDGRGLGHLYKVQAERWVPNDTVYLFDHHAFEANEREFLSRPPDWRP